MYICKIYNIFAKIFESFVSTFFKVLFQTFSALELSQKCTEKVHKIWQKLKTATKILYYFFGIIVAQIAIEVLRKGDQLLHEHFRPELEFLNSLWGLGTEEE